jgi:leader peptidase (prepilin peptidase)/N-methyltransferase
MIRILGTIFAGLLGLAFGSFLNVCLSRWPQGESIVHPRSHCRNCDHTLAWWENVPLVSWLALRGRCRECKTWIGWRYPVVEAAVGGLWAITVWRLFGEFPYTLHLVVPYVEDIRSLGWMVFEWLLIALAVLDAEHLWLPDWITLPGTALGVVWQFVVGYLSGPPRPIVMYQFTMASFSQPESHMSSIGNSLYWALPAVAASVMSIVIAAGLILLIRWVYWLIRRREGLGLGDVKLMAMLGAWLMLPGALMAFALGIVLGAAVALTMLAVPRLRSNSEGWALQKLPLGTFLCIGGVVSGLWGKPMIAAYLRWCGY